MDSDFIKAFDAYFGVTEETPFNRAEAAASMDVAQLIYDARMAKGWTQKELAKRARTTQSGVARFEDPDYSGFKLGTIARLFQALDLEMVISVRPINAPTPAKRTKRATKAATAPRATKKARKEPVAVAMTKRTGAASKRKRTEMPVPSKVTAKKPAASKARAQRRAK